MRCWAIRFGADQRKTQQLASGGFKTDTTYIIQFVLKGLTAFGDDFSGIGNTIPGYRDRLGTTY